LTKRENQKISSIESNFLQKEKQTIEDYTKKIANALKTIGLINIQYAVKDGIVYMLEANPGLASKFNLS